MKPETIPIIIDRPDLNEVEIYPIHDLHYGNECFDAHRWNELSTMILSKPNRFVCFVGDLMENAVPNSKSDMFAQTATPHEQQAFVESVFKQFADRTLAIVDGNHEFNRSTRNCGLFPLYSAACVARVDEKYRSAYAILDIGFGNVGQVESRAVGLITHRAKNLKNFGAVDATEGFDFMFFGHDHEPEDHSRGHLCYDRRRHELTVRSIEQINSGSLLTYGGYGARAGYRPKSEKMYKLVLRNTGHRQKQIESVGFYI